MLKPLVSIIVPNYNHAPYLKQRLDTILNQTYSNFEIIILDDFSTDNSQEVISLYKSNPKIKHCVFNKVNTGNTFIQWNKGIALAKGKYIWIAESDDFCEVNLLKELIEPMENDNDIVLSYSQSNRVDINGKVTGNWLSHTNDLDRNLFLSNFIMEGNDFIENFLINRNVIPNASAVLVKKDEIINKINTINTKSNLKYCGDWLFYLQIISNKKISYNSKKLNNFRYHSSSVIARAKNKINRLEIIIIDLEIRNIILNFLQSQKLNNLNKIRFKNILIKKELTYEKALIYYRNNKKIKGLILMLTIPVFFLKKYQFKKNLKKRFNSFLKL